MSVRVSMSSPDISACSGLMYAGVPIACPNAVNERLLRQPLPGGLRDAEVDDLRHGRPSSR